MDEVGGSAQTATPSRPARAVWALPLTLVVLVAVLVGGALALGRSTGTTDHAPTTLDLATVEPAVAEHYHAAEAHRSLYADIPCYCGCEEFLGHRHLADCFLRPGAGYEPHAAGCGVCLAESSLVRDLLADGTDPEAIPGAVIARFGTTPPTAPTT